MFEKVARPVRIYQEVADKIEEVILSGQLQEGDRLPSERELALTLDISRRTLREALRLVEQRGLIHINNTGTFVKVTTTERLTESLALAVRSQQISWKDIAQYRAVMDGVIAERATQNATSDDIRELESIIAAAESVISGKKLDWSGYFDLDRRLHLTLARMADNRIYDIITRTFLDNLRPYYEAYRTHEAEFCRENLLNMKSIVEAVKRGDVKAARELAEEHVNLGTVYREKAGVD